MLPTVIVPILDEEIPNLKKEGVGFDIIADNYNGDPVYEMVALPVEMGNIVRLIGADRKFCDDYRNNNSRA